MARAYICRFFAAVKALPRARLLARQSNEGEAKQWARHLRPMTPDPASLNIAITVDGGRQAVDHHTSLAAPSRTFRRRRPQGLLIPTLIPSHGPAGASIESCRARGQRDVRAPDGVRASSPVLFLTRARERDRRGARSRIRSRHHVHGGGCARLRPDAAVLAVARNEITHTNPCVVVARGSIQHGRCLAASHRSRTRRRLRGRQPRLARQRILALAVDLVRRLTRRRGTRPDSPSRSWTGRQPIVSASDGR